MKKIKNVIIILSILLLVLLISTLLIQNKKNDNPYENLSEKEGTARQDEKQKLSEYSVREKNDNIFFSINDTVQLLFEYIAEGNNQAIYQMTSEEYKKKNNINVNNCISVYKKSKNKIDYYSQEIYTMQNHENIIYYVYGKILEADKLKDYYLKFKVDVNKNTFELEPLAIEEYNEAKDGKVNQIKKFTIENNYYNRFIIKNFFSDELARRYMNDYLLKLDFEFSKAYDLLEEKYKQSKFMNEAMFKNYIEINKMRFLDFTLQTCKTELKEDAIEYNILDTNNYSYKIIVYKALEYKIVLEG